MVHRVVKSMGLEDGEIVEEIEEDEGNKTMKMK